MQYLGQHFLKNNLAIKKIIVALDIQPNETVIEIGPGHGELTNELRSKNSELRIFAVEKDEKLAQLLQQKFVSDKNIKIIQGDVLKILPGLIHNSQFIIPNSSYKIVGNIPYYITGKLLRIISELENKPTLTILMVQKEVAERICAEPPQMNLLAAATQFWANPEIILRLKAKEFDPAPEVDSAVIKLTIKKENEDTSLSLRVTPKQSRFNEIATSQTPRNDGTDKNDKAENSNYTQDTENYYKLIHIIFKQPRKTLLNNLKEGMRISKEELENIIKSLDLPLNCRPQNLTIKKILELIRTIDQALLD